MELSCYTLYLTTCLNQYYVWFTPLTSFKAERYESGVPP